MTADGLEARKSIYRTALILTVLTVFEFILAGIKGFFPDWFGISPSTAKTLVLVTFVVLTIFKAFYIVAEFMHLRHEVKRLALTILIPFVFIIWLIIGLILEGGYWGKMDKQSGSQAVTPTSDWIAAQP
ncbi:MAG: cytochrome C oxidase subunit IV family protein [Bacteroidia bacterium]|nr:cytochrome C oxidase subunit IV family protein [Bacteroidia bacterium]